MLESAIQQYPIFFVLTDLLWPEVHLEEFVDGVVEADIATDVAEAVVFPGTPVVQLAVQLALYVVFQFHFKFVSRYLIRRVLHRSYAMLMLFDA